MISVSDNESPMRDLAACLKIISNLWTFQEEMFDMIPKDPNMTKTVISNSIIMGKWIYQLWEKIEYSENLTKPIFVILMDVYRRTGRFDKVCVRNAYIYKVTRNICFQLFEIAEKIHASTGSLLLDTEETDDSDISDIRFFFIFICTIIIF